MKRRVVTIIATAVCAFLLFDRQPPQIAIFIDGRPVANLEVQYLGGGGATTDQHGVVTKPAGGQPESLVLLKMPDGNNRLMPFPRYGRREYWYNGPRTTVIWHRRLFGIIPITTETTSVDLTDEESAQISTGELTREDFLP